MFNIIVWLFCLGIKYQCLILLFSDLVECIYNAINKTMQSTRQPDNTNVFLFIIIFLNITTKSQNHNIKH